MSYKYKTFVNEAYEFEISSAEVNTLDVTKSPENKYHILKNFKSFHAKITHVDNQEKKYQVEVNGNLYKVVIADQIDSLIKEMGFAVGASKEINTMIAPMPGLILEIFAVAGQSVKEGEALLTLSAMKMENSFISPRDGVIKAIHVSKDQAVDKGQLLIEFENEN